MDQLYHGNYEAGVRGNSLRRAVTMRTIVVQNEHRIMPVDHLADAVCVRRRWRGASQETLVSIIGLLEGGTPRQCNTWFGVESMPICCFHSITQEPSHGGFRVSARVALIGVEGTLTLPRMDEQPRPSDPFAHESRVRNFISR